MIVADFFIHIIGHAWIEDPLQLLIQQPLNVSMHRFGRQTGRITRNTVLCLMIHRFCRLRRYDSLISQLMEEFHPERQQIIHIQYLPAAFFKSISAFSIISFDLGFFSAICAKRFKFSLIP